MALSGTLKKSVGANHQIVLEWTATQDYSENTSRIVATLYWQSLNSYGSVSSSASKNYVINIDTYESDGTFSAALSGTQKKKIGTYIKTLNHDSDGRLVANMGFAVGINVTLSGTYYGTQTLYKDFTLDTIPKKSTINSVPARLTFPSNPFVTWQRKTAGDYYRLRFFVEDEANTESPILIATRSNIKDTYLDIILTQTEKNAIIAERYVGNGTAFYELTTYASDGTVRGTHTKEAVIEIPERATIAKGGSLPNYEVRKPYTLKKDGADVWDISVEVVDATTQTLLATIPKFNDTTIWTPAENLIPTGQTERNIIFKIYSFYNNRIIRNDSVNKTTKLVRSIRPPVWSTSVKPSIIDTNATTTALTGDNTKLIQRLSTVTLTIPVGAATPQDGATLAAYRVYVNDQYINDFPASTTSVTIGTINASGNQTIKIHAVDNYGNSAIKEMPITLIKYANPSITSNNIGRLNGYLGTITGAVSGMFAPILVNNVAKNALSSVTLFYKNRNASSYTEVGNYTITVDPAAGTFKTGSQQILNLSESETYDIKVVATDRFGNTGTLITSVTPGVPLVFFDKDKFSVGFGGFPTLNNAVEVFLTAKIHSVLTLANEVTSTHRITALELFSTSGKLYLTNNANLQYNASLPGIVASKDLYNVNNKKYWNQSSLEIQYGSIFTSNDAGVAKEIHVTFPEAFVANVPNVQLTVAVSAAQNIVEATVYGVTKTGFTIYFVRSTTVSTNANEIKWLAVAKA